MIGLEPSASVVVRLPRTLAEREGSRASAARRFVRGAGSRRSLAMHLRNCGSRAARSSPTLRRKSASRARTRVFVGEVASGKSLGARYYAPWLGRWTTADPLGLQAGLNLYLYGRASPVVMVDPNGMQEKPAQESVWSRAARATKEAVVGMGTAAIEMAGTSAQLSTPPMWFPYAYNLGHDVLGPAYAEAGGGAHGAWEASKQLNPAVVARERLQNAERLSAQGESQAAAAERARVLLPLALLIGGAQLGTPSPTPALATETGVVVAGADTAVAGTATAGATGLGLGGSASMMSGERDGGGGGAADAPAGKATGPGVGKSAGRALSKAAAKAAAERAPRIKRESVVREQAAEADLRAQYPEAQIQREVRLRTASGKRAIDPLTQQGRNLDLVAIESGEVRDIVEVTSPDAPKGPQIAKEQRIRQSGGHFIRDRVTGLLLDISNIITRIVRRP